MDDMWDNINNIFPEFLLGVDFARPGKIPGEMQCFLMPNLLVSLKTLIIKFLSSLKAPRIDQIQLHLPQILKALSALKMT